MKLGTALIIAAFVPLPALADPASAVPPLGWLQYCGLTHDTSCALQRPLTPEDLAWVQAGIAGQFTPTEDALDRWEAFPSDKVGDCEDYALSFRAALIALGQPAESMSIVIGDAVINGKRGVHAVLEVSLGTDVWVMDGVADHLYRPSAWPYEFSEKARQVPGQVKWAAN
jgi:predicted transglutaminase-like cysteine proteinase